jgi:DNA segregation ATPase FtsK/SpoIIIE, S-DNA-T family
MPRRSPPKEEQAAPRRDFLDWLQSTQTHFGRYASDIGGVLLLTLAVLTLLGLLEVTDGALINLWVFSLQRWLGFGSSFVILTLALGGIMLLRKRKHPEARLRWGRVILLEIAAFFGLALFAMFGGYDIQRAGQGLDGGYVGWALAELLAMLFGDLILRDIVIVLGFLVSAFLGLGLLGPLENFLWKISGELPSSPPDDFQAIPGPDSAEAPEADSPRPAPPPKKPAAPLPAQFRKNFKVPESQDEKPVDPLPRSEDLPPLNLLFGEQSARPDERHINQTAGLIEKTLDEFGIPARVIGFRIGPTITQFAVQPGFIKKPGSSEDDPHLLKVRVAQIAALQKDLALALSAQRLRIEAPVPGKSYVGIEVPNMRSSTVRLRSILESDPFSRLNVPLALALGRDVSGQPLVADLGRMPHLLIAGATGAGKSVCVTALAACLAMNNSPDELRIVMIDAKMVELLRFNGLPHLYGKVETDVTRIMGVLRWVVVEMEHRYRLLEGAHVRDLESYNRKMQSRKDGHPLPRIVVIVDELADLMMSAPDQTEHNLVRLAQMARATGIHLVVATQRPSTDVVTGLIKANFPARLAFSVASGVDSRVILDTPGAETLLGRGDLLFLNPEVGNPIRAQGVYVTDQEIERIIAFWQKMSNGGASANPPWEAILREPEEDSDDALINQAIEIVRQSQRASASLIQRRLRIGYPRAARLLDQLEEMGIVGPSQGGGKEREVMVDREDGDEFFEEA